MERGIDRSRLSGWLACAAWVYNYSSLSVAFIHLYELNSEFFEVLETEFEQN